MGSMVPVVHRAASGALAAYFSASTLVLIESSAVWGKNSSPKSQDLIKRLEQRVSPSACVHDSVCGYFVLCISCFTIVYESIHSIKELEASPACHSAQSCVQTRESSDLIPDLRGYSTYHLQMSMCFPRKLILQDSCVLKPPNPRSRRCTSSVIGIRTVKNRYTWQWQTADYPDIPAGETLPACMK